MEKFFKYLASRLRSQKAMSGVIVALLLVLVGVGLIAGIGTWLKGEKDTITNEANTSIQTVITNNRP